MSSKNIYYKICEQILGIQSQTVANFIIEKEQCAYVKGAFRYIGEKQPLKV